MWPPKSYCFIYKPRADRQQGTKKVILLPSRINRPTINTCFQLPCFGLFAEVKIKILHTLKSAIASYLGFSGMQQHEECSCRLSALWSIRNHLICINMLQGCSVAQFLQHLEKALQRIGSCLMHLFKRIYIISRKRSFSVTNIPSVAYFLMFLYFICSPLLSSKPIFVLYALLHSKIQFYNC